MAGEKVTAKDSSSTSPNKGHLSNQDTDCSPNDIEPCTNLPSELGIPLYAGQPARPQWCPL